MGRVKKQAPLAPYPFHEQAIVMAEWYRLEMKRRVGGRLTKPELKDWEECQERCDVPGDNPDCAISDLAWYLRRVAIPETARLHVRGAFLPLYALDGWDDCVYDALKELLLFLGATEEGLARHRT